jgi:beta-glucosidase/6-phospho-beta-glucosidase/beta-galactosidase
MDRRISTYNLVAGAFPAVPRADELYPCLTEDLRLLRKYWSEWKFPKVLSPENEAHIPENFVFGTSTAAAQIETAYEHDWQGVKARNGSVFERTTDHEKRFKEDAEIIASLAPNYRLSLMWSKLQRSPYGQLDAPTLKEYRHFIADLKGKGVNIMMVLHHFTNPLWFSKAGGWEKTEKHSAVD